jgi:DNA-binding CsgD family transcriptional regulator
MSSRLITSPVVDPIDQNRDRSDIDEPDDEHCRIAGFIRYLVSRPGMRSDGDQSVTCEDLGDDKRIVLDITVDGHRYILVRQKAASTGGFDHLSPREQEIARMIAKGYPNKTIAAVLDISAWTVCTHLRRIFAKLGVCSRAAMVARLLEDQAVDGRR